MVAFDSIHDGGLEVNSRSLDPLRIENEPVTHTIDARLINPVNSMERRRGRKARLIRVGRGIRPTNESRAFERLSRRNDTELDVQRREIFMFINLQRWHALNFVRGGWYFALRIAPSVTSEDFLVRGFFV